MAANARPPENGTPIFIGPSRLRSIQQQLNREGFHAGHVDGIWGPVTSRALMNFQRSSGLEPTGLINLRTLEALDRLTQERSTKREKEESSPGK